MSHLEGVLTLVSDSGPWFRIQGRHVREQTKSPVGFRMAVDKASGVTVDLHLGSAVWIRTGWYPAHRACGTGEFHQHRCWARWLNTRVIERGLA